MSEPQSKEEQDKQVLSALLLGLFIGFLASTTIISTALLIFGD